MASTYCQVDFNWQSDCGAHLTREKATNVIKYSFIDIESCDFDNISFENRVNVHETHSLQFHKSGNDEGFVLTITCNSPEFSQVDAVSIDSESRTLEISNDQEGYIKTVRGRKLIHDSDRRSNDDTQRFVCSCSFGKPYTSLSIKLLSLGRKESACINSIAINIRQHNLDHRASLNGNQTFDMAKLRKDIEDMGDSVSERALDFLATMETFEKNKMSSLGGLLGPSTAMSFQSPAGHNGISSIMRSVLGDETMRNLEEDASAKDAEGSDDEHGSIYNMLQAICGKVAATRTPPKPAMEIPSTVDPEYQSADMKPINGQIPIPGTNGSHMMLLGVLDQRLEEAKQEMREEIHSVKREVIGHIDDVRREMMAQLNSITVLLQGLQANNGHSHCVQDE